MTGQIGIEVDGVVFTSTPMEMVVLETLRTVRQSLNIRRGFRVITQGLP